MSIKMDSGAPALVYIFWDDGEEAVLETTSKSKARSSAGLVGFP